MRYVTGLTGAIGITFVFKLDSTTQQISSIIHPSWQFSPLHRFRLMELNQLVYKAVRPSLLLSELVKRGIRAIGLELPVRPKNELEWGQDASPVMNNLCFTRKNLGFKLPSVSTDCMSNCCYRLTITFNSLWVSPSGTPARAIENGKQPR